MLLFMPYQGANSYFNWTITYDSGDATQPRHSLNSNAWLDMVKLVSLGLASCSWKDYPEQRGLIKHLEDCNHVCFGEVSGPAGVQLKYTPEFKLRKLLQILDKIGSIHVNGDMLQNYDHDGYIGATFVHSSELFKVHETFEFSTLYGNQNRLPHAAMAEMQKDFSDSRLSQAQYRKLMKKL